MKKYLVLIVAVMLLLAGCSGNQSKSNSDTDSAKKDDNKKEMVTYSDDLNKNVKIPKNPKRIAMMNFHYAGNFIALGKKPIVINKFAEQSNALKEQTKGITKVGDDDVEKVAKAKPDLIVTYSSDPNFKKYKKIAPTLALDFGDPSSDDAYRDILKTQAKMVNAEDKADEILKDWDKKIAKDKKDLGNKVEGKSITIIHDYPKRSVLVGKNMSRASEVLYGEYGMKLPDNIQKIIDDQKNARQKILSKEQIPEIKSDYVLLVTQQGDQAPITEDSNWKTIKAYKEDHVLKQRVADSAFSDFLTLDSARKDLKKQLLEK